MLESNFQSQTFVCDLFGEYGHHPIILFCIFYIQKTSLRQKPVPVFQFKEVHITSVTNCIPLVLRSPTVDNKNAKASL